jgi:UDP-galactopyranose mutase
MDRHDLNNVQQNNGRGAYPDLICLSHLRWDFVYQRPQHLLSRFARQRRVFFIEEPIFDSDTPRMDISHRGDGLWVVVPHLPEGMSPESNEAAQEELIQGLLAERGIHDYILWYYTPMALGFTENLEPLAVIYDCMDELSAFKGASPALRQREANLFKRADVVFTGGQSLYEVKREQHDNVHAFPSSIDVSHFGKARQPIQEPADQGEIPGPKLGFCGVIDERMDIELLDGIAARRPDWHLVMIGPVVKIDPAALPQRPNIHYLGGRSYDELPAYISGWSVGLLPFAMNESTRFISPTKTPEYLAAGKPVVSTPIRDVVRPYGENNHVYIAATVDEFVDAIEVALKMQSEEGFEEWLRDVDEFLARSSWDMTWERMSKLIDAAVQGHRRASGAASSATAQVV